MSAAWLFTVGVVQALKNSAPRLDAQTQRGGRDEVRPHVAGRSRGDVQRRSRVTDNAGRGASRHDKGLRLRASVALPDFRTTN